MSSHHLVETLRTCDFVAATYSVIFDVYMYQAYILKSFKTWDYLFILIIGITVCKENHYLVICYCMSKSVYLDNKVSWS